MTKQTKLLALFLLFACPIFAQKAPIKFGEVPPEDLKLTTYSADTTAIAVVLADYGVSTFTYSEDKGFMIRFERTMRIKILKQDGTKHGTFEIPLYKDGTDKEKITSLKAITFNEVNGKVEQTKMKNESVFVENHSKYYDITKFALPNVKQGSVIDVSYETISNFLFNFQDWSFQSTIPVRYSEYRARIPEYFIYEKYLQGYVGLTVNEQKSIPTTLSISYRVKESRDGAMTERVTEQVQLNENTFRWVAEKVPAFIEEPNITTYKDYISKINFELAYVNYPNQTPKKIMGTWADISKKFTEFEDFGGEVKGNAFLKKTVEEITANATSPEQKVQAIYSYVKKNYSWNGLNRIFVDGSLRKVVDAKKGSSADINILLTSMINKADIQAFPVLMSTRDNGFVRREFPMASQFNYVVCLVRLADKSVLLDATEGLLQFGVLPERCLNGKGLVITGEREEWVNLESGVKSKTVADAKVSINGDGVLKGKVKINNSGYHAYDYRKKFMAKGEEDFVKEFLDGKTWSVTQKNFVNIKEIQEPFIQEYELEIEDAVVVAGDMMYIKPNFLLQDESNPYKLEKREYPVDYGSPFELVYTGNITIPEGYTVEELPTQKVLRLPENGARFMYNVNVIGETTVSITSVLSINRAIYDQLEYPNLREFYGQMVAKHAEQIVLKRK